MTDLESRAIIIRPIISYPREAEVGKTYLMSIDVQAELGEEGWPYEHEDYALHCFLDTKPLFNHQSFGEPIIVLNRFGGTYGPATFLLTAAATPQEGAISISLVNEQGMPLHQMTLPNVSIVQEVKKPVKTVPRPENSVPEPPQETLH